MSLSVREFLKSDNIWGSYGQEFSVLFFIDSRCILLGDRGKKGKGKGSPYSITERMVLELIPVLCSQPAGDVSHKPGGRLPLLSARPAVTLATLKRAATNFAAW